MTIDVYTLTLATAVVVVVAGATFIVDTLLRTDDIAGRVWSLGYLSGILTVVAYLFWSASPDAWWAVAVGNAAFVLSAGFMWLGARVFNGRIDGWWIAVVGWALAAGISVVAAGPDGGGWAGAIVMFTGIAVFTGVGAVESLSGSMRANRNARGLALVLLLQSLFFVVRTVLFLAVGPDDEVFRTWVGTQATSLVTIVLMIVAAITMSVLRAERARLRDTSTTTVIGYTADGVLPADSFHRVVDDWLERAEAHGEGMALFAVHLDDLDDVTTAFGGAVAGDVVGTWIGSVRRSAPAQSAIGHDGSGRLLFATPARTEEEARAVVDALRDDLLDLDVGRSAGIRPTMSIGVAFSSRHGHSVAALIDAAREAADRAAAAGGDAVAIDQEPGQLPSDSVSR